MSLRRLVPCLLALLAAGCSSFELEPEPPYLAVRGQRIVRDLAVHTYFMWRRHHDAYPRKVDLGRGEVRHDPAAASLWNPADRTYTLLQGEEALSAIARLHEAASEELSRAEYGTDPYQAWPGPNSNTLVADLCRRAGIAADLPSTAIGQDWPTLVPWVFDARPTTTRTGLQLDLFGVLGLQLGLREGIELHLIGSKIGLDFWPPALELPVAERIGFPEELEISRVDDLWDWVEARWRDPNPRLREAAARHALLAGWIREAETTPQGPARPDSSVAADRLFELLGDHDSRVRAAAAATFARCSWNEWSWYTGRLRLPERLLPALSAAVLSTTRHEDPALRAQGFEALAYLRLGEEPSPQQPQRFDRGTLAAFQRGVWDPDPRVARKAAQGLAFLAIRYEVDAPLRERALAALAQTPGATSER